MLELWENDWDSEQSYLQSEVTARVNGGQNQTGETFQLQKKQEGPQGFQIQNHSCSSKIIFQSAIHLRLLFFYPSVFKHRLEIPTFVKNSGLNKFTSKLWQHLYDKMLLGKSKEGKKAF